jgi:sec-independent protein translocase protein TatB
MAVWMVPPTIETASIGIPDTMLLMLLALVVFGPRRLPEIGRQIGKLMYEFRKVSNDFKFQMEEELRASEEAERQRKLAEAQAQTALAAPSVTVATDTAVAETAVAELAVAETAPEAAADAGAESEPAAVEAAAVSGEVRGEPRRFPADHVPGHVPGEIRIQPPATGETVAAQKPFRGRQDDVTTESGDAATHELNAPVIVADEGRIGTEVQPGVDAELTPRAAQEPGIEANAEVATEDGREVHHA